MGRPKLNQENKKIKLGITISKQLNEALNLITYNKSNFIEELILNYFNIKNNNNGQKGI
jgi:hypothetical protein